MSRLTRLIEGRRHLTQAFKVIDGEEPKIARKIWQLIKTLQIKMGKRNESSDAQRKVR